MANTRARQLRLNQTDAEKKLRSKLRELKIEGFHFRRQAPLGKYIADFACHSAKLVIECDGGQHGGARVSWKDSNRTAWLESQGYEVMRFWNSEVLENIEGVMLVIGKELGVK